MDVSRVNHKSSCIEINRINHPVIYSKKVTAFSYFAVYVFLTLGVCRNNLVFAFLTTVDWSVGGRAGWCLSWLPVLILLRSPRLAVLRCQTGNGQSEANVFLPVEEYQTVRLAGGWGPIIRVGKRQPPSLKWAVLSISERRLGDSIVWSLGDSGNRQVWLFKIWDTSITSKDLNTYCLAVGKLPL